MNRQSHEDKVASYFRKMVSSPDGALESFQSASMPTLESRTSESSFTDEREVELVRSADKKLVSGEPLTGEEAGILEAIILPAERPVIDILGNSFHRPDHELWSWLDNAAPRKAIESAIPSIGRVDITGDPTRSHLGTGFLVGPDLLLTNRHVADDFVNGVGRNLTFMSGFGANVDLKREILPAPALNLTVKEPLMIHPFWDAAFLRVSGIPSDVKPLRLTAVNPAALEDRYVAAIGYPAFDPRNRVDVQNRVFRGVFGVKRLQPGKVIQSLDSTLSFGNQVDAMTHDCSTLGGNSGSALIDIETGNVVGLHFAGIYLEQNYAVPAAELLRDPKVRELGVVADGPADSSTPTWLVAWEPLESAEDGAPTTPAAPPIAPKSSELVLAPGWFERMSDQEIARLLKHYPDETRQHLNELLGEVDAVDLINDLQEADRQETSFTEQVASGVEAPTEGIFFDRVDPLLPEIIFAHGIMGGHLANAGFLRDRLWMDPLELLSSDLAQRLKLGPDMTDAPGMRVEHDGHLRLFYGKAARKWRKAGFVVHEFSFDWRRSVASAAQQLNDLIERRFQENGGKQFVLVGHSMGGLVISTYGARFSNWQDRVAQAIFMGSPLGGSYAVPITVLGGGMAATLGAWSRGNVAEYARMARSLPGLIDMLPNPGLFADAVGLYGQAGWPSNMAPLQHWLTQSRNLKSTLRESPLLDRTTLFVSLGHGTVETMPLVDGQLVPGPATGIGDGTVPARSAVVESVPAYKVDEPHGDLPKDPKCIQGVIDMIKQGSVSLASVRDEDLVGQIPITETLESLGSQETKIEAARADLERGELTPRAMDLLTF